ncbi:unnamed protein product [Meloidogyne enterolobii]|uniref:Uncharacterized protein n=1 Tax=Meloidogyne enterolobii TaxID=390850 RepID=A0ACB1A5H0_MELEN
MYMVWQAPVSLGFKDLYWPNVMLTRAFEAIKDEEIQLINYNQSAERIGKELLKRGLPG